MEKYIQKINDKLLEKDDIDEARKIKKKYQIIGGVLLAIGLAGFLALFIAFMVLFLYYKTDEAVTCWFIAIPFLLLLVPGSVITRIGDQLLPEDKASQRKKRFYKYKSEKLRDKQAQELVDSENLQKKKKLKNID